MFLFIYHLGHFWGLFCGYGRQTKSSTHKNTSFRVLTVLVLVNWTKANLTGSQSANTALHFNPFWYGTQRNQTSLNGLSKARFTGSWRVDMSGVARELNNTCYIPVCGRLPPLRSGDTPIIKLNFIPSFNANNTFRPSQCIRRRRRAVFQTALVNNNAHGDSDDSVNLELIFVSAPLFPRVSVCAVVRAT